jgi:hypothetical protein
LYSGEWISISFYTHEKFESYSLYRIELYLLCPFFSRLQNGQYKFSAGDEFGLLVDNESRHSSLFFHLFGKKDEAGGF